MSESAGYIMTRSKSRRVNEDNMSNSNDVEPTAGSSSNYQEDISLPVQPQALNTSTTNSNGIPTVRGTSRPGSKTSRASRLSREARMKRAQYEAELELQRLTEEKVRARERVIQSKLELEMAEIEAEDAESEEDDELRHAGTPAYSVEAWLKNAQPPAPVASPRPSLRASPPPSPVPVPRTAPPTPPPPHVTTSQCPPKEPHAREPSTERRRSTSIDMLREAISGMTRPRPVPKQAYEIPKFDGNPTDWLGFKTAYETSTAAYEFKPFENVARLRVALVGDAKVAVEDLLRSACDPGEVIRALEDSFGHPSLLLDCALKKVKNLPRVSESGRELRSFTAAVRNCVALLKAVRAEGYINNPQIVNELLAKLTPYQRAQYGSFARRMDTEIGVDLRVSPNLQMLVKFLTDLTHESSYYATAQQSLASAPAPSASRVRDGRNTTPVKTTHRVHAHVEAVKDESSVCVLCNKDHQLDKCDKFKDLSVSERWAIIKDKKMCFRCLVKSHSRKFCRARRCTKCKWPHHVLLHADRAEVSSPLSPQTTTDTGLVTM